MIRYQISVDLTGRIEEVAPRWLERAAARAEQGSEQGCSPTGGT